MSQGTTPHSWLETSVISVTPDFFTKMYTKRSNKEAIEFLEEPHSTARQDGRWQMAVPVAGKLKSGEKG